MLRLLRNNKNVQGRTSRFIAFVLAIAFAFSAAPEAAADGSEKAVAAEETNWNDRYAVALYGIQHDRYANAEGEVVGIAGLTFGPASGTMYLEKYRSHVKRAEYEKNPRDNICLHWMSWEEIAEQSLEDPTVFHDCLVHGCTHAVDLRLNSTLLAKNYSKKIKGDGAGAILDGVKRGFLCWNKGPSCPGGWPACRARAVLNGRDDLTDPNAAGEKYLLSSDECLFSCFPEELQERIAAKAVVSDLGNGTPKRNCVTTYDRLWLFSASELYGGRSRAEGDLYERAKLILSRKAGFSNGFMMYSEKGNEAWAWLRSISGLDEVIYNHIYGGGHKTEAGYYNHFGLAPGFCLP